MAADQESKGNIYWRTWCEVIQNSNCGNDNLVLDYSETMSQCAAGYYLIFNNCRIHIITESGCDDS